MNSSYKVPGNNAHSMYEPCSLFFCSLLWQHRTGHQIKHLSSLSKKERTRMYHTSGCQPTTMAFIQYTTVKNKLTCLEHQSTFDIYLLELRYSRLRLVDILIQNHYYFMCLSYFIFFNSPMNCMNFSPIFHIGKMNFISQRKKESWIKVKLSQIPR